MALIYTLLITLFATQAMAIPQKLSCKKLVNGNYNGKAGLTAKSVELEMDVDLERSQVDLTGFVLTKQGGHYYEDQKVWISSYFPDPRIERSNDQLLIRSFERGLLMCGQGSGTGPCRLWSNFLLNFKTGEAVFEQKYSYQRFAGEIVEDRSLHMVCELQ